MKPFSTAEPTARIATVLRRTGTARPAGRLQFDGPEIDLARHEVTVRGKPVDLPSREYEVLASRASSPGAIFTREQLLERLWPRTAGPSPGTATQHIGRIRRRIEEDPEHPRWITPSGAPATGSSRDRLSFWPHWRSYVPARRGGG